MTFVTKDPCGLICILLTYVAVFYADYVIIVWVIMTTMEDSLWAPFHAVIFNTVIFLVSFAHLRAMCADPGKVPLPATRMDFSDVLSGQEAGYMQKEDWTVCARCETYRPPRAHHCRICQRCIRRMDHHCPWINNCVGELNQKYFIQFLIYVGILSAYAIILVAVSWIKACPSCSNDINVTQSRMVHCIILVMESFLFGIFVLAILYDQLESISSDKTTIEQLQGSNGQMSFMKLIMSHLCRLPCYGGALSSTSTVTSPTAHPVTYSLIPMMSQNEYVD